MKRTVMYEVTEIRKVEIDTDVRADAYWKARKKIHKNQGEKVGRRKIKFLASY